VARQKQYALDHLVTYADTCGYEVDGPTRDAMAMLSSRLVVDLKSPSYISAYLCLYGGE
jgi:hypothetical protein